MTRPLCVCARDLSSVRLHGLELSLGADRVKRSLPIEWATPLCGAHLSLRPHSPFRPDLLRIVAHPVRIMLEGERQGCHPG